MDMAIIGHGFVGKAVDAGFNDPRINKILIDPNYGTNLRNLKHVNVDLACVCVPTPMRDDGGINPMAVIEAVDYLKQNTKGLIVIKSTITPNIIEVLKRGPAGKRVIYNPEFLAERNAVEEFLNPKLHIFGGDRESCEKLKWYYDNYSACRPAPVHYVSYEEASFIKYGINCFLASKIMWFNQFCDVIRNNTNASYSRIINAMVDDPRIGGSHTTVPGFDGKYGFGGACFPKDTSAFLNYSHNTFSILEEVIKANNEVRAQYDVDEREQSNNISYVQSSENVVE